MIICDVLLENIEKGIIYIKVKDINIVLVFMVVNYFGNFFEKLKLVGVIGINGKIIIVLLLF